jgi:putative ABC transport system permease protein
MLIGAFAMLALLLAAVGIYGVIAYSVSQRTQEIGVRMALGAGRWDVLRMILGQGAILAAIGIAIGLAGALALTRLLADLLFSVQPTDPATFVAVSMLLAVVSVCAGFLPARRATRIDPLAALRWE